jgi:hypothetical protein
MSRDNIGAAATTFTVLAALSLHACSLGLEKPIHVYAGPIRPVEEISVLKAHQGTRVEAIDGQPQPYCMQCEMHLLPGMHTLTLREQVPSSVPGQWVYIDKRTRDVEVLAAQGHTYSVACVGDLKIRLIDDKTQTTLISEQPEWHSK